MNADVQNVRKDHRERESYVANIPQETFIVPLLRAEIERTIGRWSRSKNKTVLDVGCGRQPFRKCIQESGMNYVSFDVRSGSNGPVDHLGSIDDKLPESLGGAPKFDFILCTEVLEHVGNWENAFRNLRSLLAPGGELFITCPFFYPLHEEPHDFWRPTAHALKLFAHRNEFEILEQKTLGDISQVLGTLCGAMLSTMNYVKPRGVWHRIQISLSQRWLRFVLSWLFGAIRHGKLQANFGLNHSVYVANTLLLRGGPRKGDPK